MILSLIIDYFSCLFFKFFGFVLSFLPVSSRLFLGRRLGDLFYCFDRKRRAVAHANLREAFSAKLSPREINGLTKKFYRNLGQSFIEIFFIPYVDKKYIEKYITFEGLEYVTEAFKKGKGVIFVAMHSGSWELSNVFFANMGFVYNILVREQNMPRLDEMLDEYRRLHGCRLIHRHNQARELIEALKRNEALAMTIDQGGKDGIQVSFFNRRASMAVGAMKLALKYGCQILPGYHTRIDGPYLKTIFSPPFELSKTGNTEKDIKDNLEKLVPVFENYIEKYPQDYFWRYKIWKYSLDKRILVLSDGKAGHLNQAKAAAKIAGDYLKASGTNVSLHIEEVSFKNKTSRHLLTLAAYFSSNFNYRRAEKCLEKTLTKESYAALQKIRPDIIISCGSSLAAVNFFLSAENMSKSVAIMKPSVLPGKKFSLIIMPEHDRHAKWGNLLTIQGSLNAIDANYLRDSAQQLAQELKNNGVHPMRSCVGLLIGGDSKNFRLEHSVLAEVIKQVKQFAGELDLDILLTTSRRTPKDVEDLVRKEFKGYNRCKFLVIANEKNYPFAVGGILAQSKFLVVSPESISMISEAASAHKHVVVFNAEGLKKKHAEFLAAFSSHGYIKLCEAYKLKYALSDLAKNNPEVKFPKNEAVIREALGKIL